MDTCAYMIAVDGVNRELKNFQWTGFANVMAVGGCIRYSHRISNGHFCKCDSCLVVLMVGASKNFQLTPLHP